MKAKKAYLFVKVFNSSGQRIDSYGSHNTRRIYGFIQRVKFQDCLFEVDATYEHKFKNESLKQGLAKTKKLLEPLLTSINKFHFYLKTNIKINMQNKNYNFLDYPVSIEEEWEYFEQRKNQDRKFNKEDWFADIPKKEAKLISDGKTIDFRNNLIQIYSD